MDRGRRLLLRRLRGPGEPSHAPGRDCIRVTETPLRISCRARRARVTTLPCTQGAQAMHKAGTYRAAGLGAVLLLVISLTSFSSPAHEKPPTTLPAVEARDFSGRYLADGIGNGGRPYRAMVEIRR